MPRTPRRVNRTVQHLLKRMRLDATPEWIEIEPRDDAIDDREGTQMKKRSLPSRPVPPPFPAGVLEGTTVDQHYHGPRSLSTILWLETMKGTLNCGSKKNGRAVQDRGLYRTTHAIPAAFVRIPIVHRLSQSIHRKRTSM